MQNISPKPLKVAQKADILLTFRVQVEPGGCRARARESLPAPTQIRTWATKHGMSWFGAQFRLQGFRFGVLGLAVSFGFTA